ncbi:hypothetical protein Taro_003089 [Colocasia esculenta]|uniref:Uncharacterized protein n=1 Tax=Colocasia esculenta TaxID=4460 RepID=A0A843TN69_COLES|nr:hypothetical protein [Colocasia esculenta]
MDYTQTSTLVQTPTSGKICDTYSNFFTVETVSHLVIFDVKKPTSWYKPQCGSARLKPPSRFYTVNSPKDGQKSFL